MSGEAPSPDPLAKLITEARAGRLNLRIEPEQFVYIEQDCQRFKDLIRYMQREAEYRSCSMGNRSRQSAIDIRTSLRQTLPRKGKRLG